MFDNWASKKSFHIALILFSSKLFWLRQFLRHVTHVIHRDHHGGHLCVPESENRLENRSPIWSGGQSHQGNTKNKTLKPSYGHICVCSPLLLPLRLCIQQMTSTYQINRSVYMFFCLLIKRLKVHFYINDDKRVC